MKTSRNTQDPRRPADHSASDNASSRILFEPPFPGAESMPESPDERRNRAMKGSPLERASFVGDIVIHTDEFMQAFATIEALMERARGVRQPGGLCITGEGGTGKTFIRESLVKRYPREETAWRTYCPVLAIEMSDTPTPRQFVLNLLLGTGYCSTHGGQSEDVLKNILLKALLDCSTRIIVVDEGHHLIPSSGSRKNTERLGGAIGEVAKFIYDKSAIPFVWSGRHSLGDLFDKDKQLDTRWSGRIRLEEYKCDTAWQVLLDVLDEALPMEEKCGLGELPRSQFVHLITKGNFRRLKVYLSECVRIASCEASRAISKEHFDRAQYALAL
ncbi:TniB family NTP-binding protein [Paraburkholderia acidicola]|uniref:TniB family NTP-binding protein n=1 Tax=Paraburkholderia acidicola TaxID=1912599 RepID=A0ABV1LLH2_9BURK